VDQKLEAKKLEMRYRVLEMVIEEKKTSGEVGRPRILLYLYCKRGRATSEAVTCSSHAFSPSAIKVLQLSSSPMPLS
jgi:hypothetical protein